MCMCIYRWISAGNTSLHMDIQLGVRSLIHHEVQAVTLSRLSASTSQTGKRMCSTNRQLYLSENQKNPPVFQPLRWTTTSTSSSRLIKSKLNMRLMLSSLFLRRRIRAREKLDSKMTIHWHFFIIIYCKENKWSNNNINNTESVLIVFLLCDGVAVAKTVLHET